MNDPRRRVRVDPQLVFGISLLVSLAISWDGFSKAMHGSADIVAVGMRFLIAVGVVWTGLFLVASLLASYAAAPAAPAAPAPRAATGRPHELTGDINADVAAAAAIAADTESAAG